MNSIEQFLSQAPKTFLNKIHQKNLSQGSGLIRNAQLVADVNTWAVEFERINQFIQSLSELQQQMVRAIYTAGPQGLSRQQLILFLPENERFLIKQTLLQFSWNLISYTVKSDEGERIFGFQDLKPIIFQCLPTQVDKESTRLHWLDNSMMASFHFISMASQIQIKPWKLSQSLEPHRRSLNTLESRFEFTSAIDPILTKVELGLLIDFGRDCDYLMHHDHEMILNPTFIQNLSQLGTFPTEMVEWWLKRISWTEDHLQSILERYQEPVSLADSLNDWWVLEDVNYIPKLQRNIDQLTWDDLPRSMIEAWSLGLIQISSSQQQLGHVQVTSWFQSFTEASSKGELSSIYFDQPAFSTPDFEAVVGVQQQCKHLFVLECMAKSITDDRVMKYKIEKARFLNALKSGLSLEMVEECLEWIQLPGTPRISVQDWMNSFKEASFSRPLVLEILSESTRNTLKGITSFSDHIIKELPGFGFILSDRGEKDAKFLLEQLGFFPSFDGEEAFITPQSFPKNSVTPSETEPETTYPTLEPSEGEQIQMGELSQYGKSFKELHISQIIRILKYCIICDISIEVFWKTKTSQKATVQPKEIDPETQEILRAMDEATNQMIDIPIQSISNLKMVDNY